ncbi:hypothetical protein C8F04DRAFT_1329960 [Mycena alexandri]|uniref:Uncharacterized protein n=1 Tax=Mycena alexandri TaxID=1745969 RepID=A0AAD6T1J0_9AGAR|nr:hypothetical protein C8F04DRAFT_1329960 [Mycena alexandri]
MLVTLPQDDADTVKISFVKQPTSSGEELFFSQPPIPGFAKTTVQANVELVDADSPIPRGMRLITFDVLAEFNMVERLLAALNLVAEAAVSEVGPDINPTSLAALLLDQKPDNPSRLRRPGRTTFLQHTSVIKNRNSAELIKNHPVLPVGNPGRPEAANGPPHDSAASVASSPLVNSRVAKHAPKPDMLYGCGPAQLSYLSIIFPSPDGSFDPGDNGCARHGYLRISPIFEHRRECIKIHQRSGAPFRLFYGTRYHDTAALRAIVYDYVDDGTVVVEAAYSEDAGPRRFAQQTFLRKALMIWSDLSKI